MNLKDGVVYYIHKKNLIHTPTCGVTIKTDFSICVTFVSIHTPKRGVTHHICDAINNFAVSIHTPTRGVTANDGTDKVYN